MLKQDGNSERKDAIVPSPPISIRDGEMIRLLFTAARHLEAKGYNLTELEAMVSDAVATLLPLPSRQVAG